jgi:hypothetical protein
MPVEFSGDISLIHPVRAFVQRLDERYEQSHAISFD